MLGAITGALLGGLGGGGAGLATGPGAPALAPAFSLAGAATGAKIGGAVGAAIDATIVFAKGESAQIGAAIEAVMSKRYNTQQNRDEVGDYCEDCKRRGIRGTKNEKGDFTFQELKDRVREFFGLK